MTTEQEIIAESRRYIRAQQAKIQVQRELVDGLESRGADGQTVRLERETLAEMVKSLDAVLSRLRPVLHQAV